MITTFEIGSVFNIVDKASPTILKLSPAFATAPAASPRSPRSAAGAFFFWLRRGPATRLSEITVERASFSVVIRYSRFNGLTQNKLSPGMLHHIARGAPNVFYHPCIISGRGDHMIGRPWLVARPMRTASTSATRDTLARCQLLISSPCKVTNQ